MFEITALILDLSTHHRVIVQPSEQASNAVLTGIKVLTLSQLILHGLGDLCHLLCLGLLNLRQTLAVALQVPTRMLPRPQTLDQETSCLYSVSKALHVCCAWST